MKKIKFSAFFFAAVTAVSMICSCSSSKDKDKEDNGKDKDKTEVSSLKNNTSVKPDLQDFDATMNYLEAKAPSFFSEFNRVMAPINSVIENGTEPSEAEAERLESFVNQNQEMFEAIGAIMGHEQIGELTDEQNQRLQEFSDRYEEGLTNVGVLIGIGMAAEGEM